jgi:hypothetical protein
MIRHSQPQPQPQTTFCATLSSCQLQGCQKEGFIKIEREGKRKIRKRQTETKRKKELNTCKARVFQLQSTLKKTNLIRARLPN